ncbi:MAG: hypothetical protein ACLQAR_13915 [Steroidobacteraceae bacterium]
MTRLIRDFAGAKAYVNDNHLCRGQSHSFVDGSRYLSSHQSLAKGDSTVTIF